jgi:hypothetical protein
MLKDGNNLGVMTEAVFKKAGQQQKDTQQERNQNSN